PRLAGAFAQAGLVDEYHLFLAPKFLGSSARPLLDWPLEHLAQAPQLEILSATPVGADLHLIARPARDT
ncbi:dihydrofolate reductase family protein, partial [Pseudomonas sp. DE0010]